MWAGVDEAQRCAVFRIRGAVISDKQWGYYVEKIDRIARGRPGVFACVPEPGGAVPNAGWRSRFTEGAALLHPKSTFVLVTSSALARGVFTAQSWVRPFPFAATVVEAWPEALLALEQCGVEASRVATMARLYRDAARVPFE
jgi:hypothetical protein